MDVIPTDPAAYAVPVNLFHYSLVVAILNAVGRGMKTVPRLHNDWIPFLLFGVGAVAYCILEGWTRSHFAVGISAGLSAVGVHQAARTGTSIMRADRSHENPTP